MKQNRSTLYLILACLFALALPLFDYLEYIQFRQAQSTYQLGYLQLAIRPLILPMCSLLLGWFLVHFLGIQKTNRKIFFLRVFQSNPQLFIQSCFFILVQLNALVRQSCCFLYGSIIAGQCGKRRELCRTVNHRHSWSTGRNMMGAY